MVLGSTLHLETRESLFARITNLMKGADDADAREHDYEDEHNEQPDGIYVPIRSAAPACARRGTMNGRRSQLTRRTGLCWGGE